MGKFEQRRKEQEAPVTEITMISIKSSNLKAIGYEPKDEILFVDFPKATWAYRKVKKETYDALISAESHGKYFHSFIKGKYDAVKVLSEKENNE